MESMVLQDLFSNDANCYRDSHRQKRNRRETYTCSKNIKRCMGPMISELRVKVTSRAWQGLLMRMRESARWGMVSEARWWASGGSCIIFYTPCVFQIFLNKSKAVAKDHEDGSEKKYKLPVNTWRDVQVGWGMKREREREIKQRKTLDKADNRSTNHRK